MTENEIHDTMLNLIYTAGGVKLSKATVFLPNVAPDCKFEIDHARLVRRLSKLLIMDDGNEIEALNIPSSDIKSLHHRQYGKNHFISIRHQDDSCTNVDLWVA